MDKTTTTGVLIEEIGRFIDERNWSSYHDPKNLSMSISIESAELMEIFQWLPNKSAREAGREERVLDRVKDEVADILIYTLSLCRELNIDASDAVLSKLEKNKKRFPDGTITFHP